MRCPRISPLTGRISRAACRRRGPRSRDRITRRRAAIAQAADRHADHPGVRVLPGREIPPALPRKAWPPRPRSHHPVNGPPGRPRRSAYQSCARATTAPTVSGRSQPRPPRHREGPVESQSGEVGELHGSEARSPRRLTRVDARDTPSLTSWAAYPPKPRRPAVPNSIADQQVPGASAAARRPSRRLPPSARRSAH
jgi:hypothetical protein